MAIAGMLMGGAAAAAGAAGGGTDPADVVAEIAALSGEKFRVSCVACAQIQTRTHRRTRRAVRWGAQWRSLRRSHNAFPHCVGLVLFHHRSAPRGLSVHASPIRLSVSPLGLLVSRRVASRCSAVCSSVHACAGAEPFLPRSFRCGVERQQVGILCWLLLACVRTHVPRLCCLRTFDSAQNSAARSQIVLQTTTRHEARSVCIRGASCHRLDGLSALT